MNPNAEHEKDRPHLGMSRFECQKRPAPSEKECLDYWNANIHGQRLITRASCITGANIFADLGMTSLLVSREPYASKAIME